MLGEVRVSRKTPRKLKGCNKVKRSITVSPQICFGPKFASPLTTKKGKSKRMSKEKKVSSSTIKSKLTNESTPKALWKSNWEREEPETFNKRCKSTTPNLEHVPEPVELDGALLTIMDL